MNRKHQKERTVFFVVAGLVLLLLLTAASAGFLAPNDPNEVNLLIAELPPGGAYPLGTDALGRCMLSRILYGARSSLFASLFITLTVFFIGVTMGVLSGYFGGPLDMVLNKFITIMQSFPKIITVMALTGILGIGFRSIIVSLCLVEWVDYARISRSYALSLRERSFIKAARICGESHLRIIFRRIIPNIFYPLIVNASLGISGVIMSISALSYLGLGVKEPMVEWGMMISSGRAYIQSNPSMILLPGAAIFIASSLFNLLGEKLRNRCR
ncbi:ABC transporter permease [Proteiniclasticum sp. C24MP]|uniref:ABC transporter permease n=1 Tax=Proteiniclasticum sp. C24MP TaxID=3374101 RepID=UPI0037542144